MASPERYPVIEVGLLCVDFEAEGAASHFRRFFKLYISTQMK